MFKQNSQVNKSILTRLTIYSTSSEYRIQTIIIIMSMVQLIITTFFSTFLTGLDKLMCTVELQYAVFSS